VFVDLNSGEIESLAEADICIIGAGAAGISIAREFLNTNVTLLLLESGHLEFDSETHTLNEGIVSGLSYPLNSSRQRYFGGTTNHWAGQSCPLNPIDFENRQWIPNSGWPIDYEDYSPYVKRAQRVCKLGELAFEWDSWNNPLDFPLNKEIFHPVILRFPNPVVRFGREYRKDIDRASNIRCIINANATNIEIDSHGAVDHIEIKSLQGPSARVRAKKLILACGAIQNVKLLLNSRNKLPRGLGNELGLVGKYFMEHPNYDTGQVELRDPSEYPFLAMPDKRLKGAKIRTDFRLNEPLQEKFKILNHSLFLMPARNKSFSDDLGSQVAKFWHKLEGKMNSYLGIESHILRIRLEQAPREDSWVRLSEERDALGLNNVELHLQFGKLETHTIAVAQEEFAKALGLGNIGRMKINFEPGETEWMSSVGWQFHHLGGTRMSDGPEDGVVDKNCKMHSVDNLFIAGSSIFPTGGQANPTMNIVAFALRLADHLKKELKI